MTREQMINFIQEISKNSYKNYCWKCESTNEEDKELANDYLQTNQKLDSIDYDMITNEELEDLIKEYQGYSEKWN